MRKNPWIIAIMLMTASAFLGGAAASLVFSTQPVLAAAAEEDEPGAIEATALRIVEAGRVRALLDREGLKIYRGGKEAFVLDSGRLKFSSGSKPEEAWNVELGFLGGEPHLVFSELVKRPDPETPRNEYIPRARLGYHLISGERAGRAEAERKTRMFSLAFFDDDKDITWSIPRW